MILLGSTPIESENPLGCSGASHFSYTSINLTRGLVARRLFRVSLCPEGTIHLQASILRDSNPDPTALQSALLTTIPDRR
ncbi:hypothetical protein TNCV_3093911 [Trichonephila clavipes]|nr:hypothetical protein TNCV_3093911 [Trichonephila clavipes]